MVRPLAEHSFDDLVDSGAWAFKGRPQAEPGHGAKRRPAAHPSIRQESHADSRTEPPRRCAVRLAPEGSQAAIMGVESLGGIRAAVWVGDHGRDAAVVVESHHVDRSVGQTLPVPFDVKAEEKRGPIADDTCRSDAVQGNRTGDVAVKLPNGG